MPVKLRSIQRLLPVLVLAAAPAFGDSIVTATFTDLASWEAATSGDTTITFDDENAPIGSYKTYGSGGFTDDGVTFVGYNGAGYLEQVVDSGFQSPYNNWDTGATLTSAQYLTTTNTPYIQVTLPADTTAFGVDLGSLSPNGVNVQVELADGESFTVPTGTRPDLAFFGITTSSALSYIDFSLTGTTPSNGSQLVMDNFTLGSAEDPLAAPEAGTLGLIGLGLISLTALGRWRKPKATAALPAE